MAQIEQSDKGGKKKKGAQKKMHIHVDFTPMVDMNMLLITFFMLCTTMIKSQTLQITLPSNEKVEDVNQLNKAKESEAITLLLTTDREDPKDINSPVKKDENGRPMHTIYYYEGKPDIQLSPDGTTILSTNLKAESFVGNTHENGATVQQGIRKILHNRNKQVLEKIDVLKKKWREKGFDANNADRNDSLYQAAAKEVRNDSTLTRPVVIIKATPEASWESLISALDEMQINQISRYQIDNMNQTDTVMIVDYISKHPKAAK